MVALGPRGGGGPRHGDEQRRRVARIPRGPGPRRGLGRRGRRDPGGQPARAPAVLRGVPDEGETPLGVPAGGPGQGAEGQEPARPPRAAGREPRGRRPREPRPGRGGAARAGGGNARVTRAEEIAQRVADVRGRIAGAARRAGRDAASITLVAVGKTRPLDDLLAAHAAGVTAFGENRVQEAETKFPRLPPGCAAHLIGPIQSNKANRAARVATVVETIDSEDLARRLDRAA